MARTDHRDTRRDYRKGTLDRHDLAADPVAQLAAWIADAQGVDHPDPTAMVLATAGADGQPSVRAVLLKHLDEDGLSWYTDSRSLKGRQLAANPRASVLFFWPELERQVRVDGRVATLPTEFAEEYFASRPEGSRYAAATSHQSQPIDSREELERRLAEVHTNHPSGDVPRPPSWIGYRLKPDLFEFWQGRENRLHDRFQYIRTSDGWTITRLMP
ncbi:Pyridoxamine 5'-phosphate oxidase [Thioalkalivibrio nitratireducens DSM 14787]|uniref:Pyridoxine/pyridoxamine 5'-phosphate oxidase n=1 Tax=Thioalkalivibrio nitratireducens (strain DSM 14787 / UNIQEM 213 / ALEN2) TaxID=1255043 RepID=L0DW40_THIND|nr:pyridoxamine 5'-phosphate oxidase [Thioalkalivibrio nitratireducens]AGA33195.1 Pyridoxamine 5'-phosphate oxidase [Thioalkalivibrio nitratireducens DSM 14787]